VGLFSNHETEEAKTAARNDVTHNNVNRRFTARYAMKFLLRLHMPTEHGNKTLQDPNFPKKMESVLNQIKPEAVYFSSIDGERGITMIVNLPSADMIATIAEPLWMTFNCKLDFEPLMELADLQKGLQNLKK
jgi:hypothetical protein